MGDATSGPFRLSIGNPGLNRARHLGENTFDPHTRLWRGCGLFLEEVVEGAPCVFRPRRPGRGVALHRHAEREEGALVAGALVGDALGDRLGALESVPRIEVGALPAGVELRLAPGALAERVGHRRQERSAVRAAGDAPASGRRRRGRDGGLLALRRRLGRVVLIVPLAVLPIFHDSQSNSKGRAGHPASRRTASMIPSWMSA